MTSEWVVFFGAISIIGIGGWLLMRDKKIEQKPSIEDEHYRLGRVHALSGEKPSLKTEAYQDGFSDGLKELQG
ncbi:hypothetical protein ACTG1X_21570 [Aeromonas veronii]|uniref:hypothetical protein n=1 Tax=Aeromonas veronii TaxID=654 RepID=UPI003F7AC982